MKLLVTGANGYVGQFLVNYLLQGGHSVCCVTRRAFAATAPDAAQVSYYTCADYTEEQLAAAVAGQEVVIHLAARAHQPQQGDTLDAYRRANVQPSLNLAKAAVAAGVKRFIYLSSIKVNGEATTHQPFRASDLPAPQDAYGHSKWETEQALRAYLATSQTELVIIRPPLVWGGEMKGHLQLLARWINRGVPLPFGALHNRRDLISLHNLASFISLCLSHPLAAGTWLVSDGEPYSSADIARLVAAQLGKPARILPFPVALLALGRYIPRLGTKLEKLLGSLEVDATPARAQLGWQPEQHCLFYKQNAAH